MEVTIERAGFEAALDEHPEDMALRLVYADWLEEQGLDGASQTQRWMAEHKHWPSYDDAARTWDWSFQSWKSWFGWRPSCCVPDEVWDKLPNPRFYWPAGKRLEFYDSKTRQKAERALEVALRLGGEIT